MKIYNILSTAISVILLFSACNEDVKHPKPPNEEELITTVKLQFIPVGTPNVVTAMWRDLDGPGGNAPVITPIVLEDGIGYILTLELLNESDGLNVIDITTEIEDESDEHQFFFTGSSIDDGYVEYIYTDEDKNGNPVGLEGVVNSLGLGTGSFLITLKHLPGIKDENTTIADGESDVFAEFSLTVGP